MSDVPADVADGFAAAGYRALGELGRGAFGVVYAAESEAGAPLAIKVLATRDPQVLQRFRAEARLLGRIEHDGVIRVLGTGALQDGQPYIVMERFGDASLDREVPLGCAVPMAKAVDLARQLLESLAAAHAVGVVHRDVKESNVLIERATGRLKLCDLGLARSTDPDDTQATSSRSVLGTPHYIAPERYLGVRDDPRIDLYSVGVILHRLLTGRRPFEAPGDSPVVIAQRSLTEEVPPPPDAPAALAELCARLLAREPDGRPADARAALAALDRAARAPDRVTAPPQAWVMPLLIVSVLTLLALAVWFVVR